MHSLTNAWDKSYQETERNGSLRGEIHVSHLLVQDEKQKYFFQSTPLRMPLIGMILCIHGQSRDLVRWGNINSAFRAVLVPLLSPLQETSCTLSFPLWLYC